MLAVDGGFTDNLTSKWFELERFRLGLENFKFWEWGRLRKEGKDYLLRDIIQKKITGGNWRRMSSSMQILAAVACMVFDLDASSATVFPMRLLMEMRI